MTSLVRPSFVPGIGLLAACSAGVTVSADWSPGTDFSTYHTYGWLPDAQSDGSGQAYQITDHA